MHRLTDIYLSAFRESIGNSSFSSQASEEGVIHWRDLENNKVKGRQRLNPSRSCLMTRGHLKTKLVYSVKANEFLPTHSQTLRYSFPRPFPVPKMELSRVGQGRETYFSSEF